MSSRIARRRAVNAIMWTATGLCALAAVLVLCFILGYLLWSGAHYLSWNFLTKLPEPVGEAGGGMANAIVGSGKILLIAAVTGIPVGVLAGVYLAEFGGAPMAFTVRYAADLLNGVPSIVTGIFVYTVLVVPLREFSAVAGGVALGIMVIPIVTRSTEDFLRAVPGELLEGALALGASRWRGIATVVFPAALRGIATGILLSMARVAGETAPLLFTSFNNHYWASGWMQPTASLPVMIYIYAISPYPDWQRQAWAAGFLLIVLVLLINTGARALLLRGRGAGR